MIPIADLDSIAHARIEDAKVLLAGGRYAGATYLCGFESRLGERDLTSLSRIVVVDP